MRGGGAAGGRRRTSSTDNRQGGGGGGSKTPLLDSPTTTNYSLTLETILGLSTLNNAALAVNPATGDVAYPAGCVVVVYSPRRNRQVRFFRASRAVSCLTFSRDGMYLGVGERGHQPGVIVWSLMDGRVAAELKAHKFGVACLSFSNHQPTSFLVSIGYKHDRTLRVWDIKSSSLLACCKIHQKIHSLDFSEDGSFFVTAGERHVKFWRMDDKGQVRVAEDDLTEGVPTALGEAASIVDSHRSATFVDVVCGRGQQKHSVYCVTSQGTLCMFTSDGLMDQWMTLETSTAYAITWLNGLLVAACPDGLVRLFQAESLQYIATLPRPPPLSPHPSLQYPAALALRPLLPSSSPHLAVVYADHTFMIWDLTDPHNVNLYRSAQAHSACIWDIRFLPWSAPTAQSSKTDHGGDTGEWLVEDEADGPALLPPSTMATCSADNTIRLWALGSAGAAAHRRRNPYSKELMYTLHMVGDNNEDSRASRALKAAIQVGNDLLVSGSPDPELPSKPEAAFSPRCLAFHPLGQELAVGDRQGNLRLYDLTTTGGPRLKSVKQAHDAEVLSLDYSPVLSQRPDGGWSAAGNDDINSTDPKSDVILLATGSRDRLVHVFEARGDYPLTKTLENHSSSVTAVKFSVDGKSLLSCGGDKALVLSSVNGLAVARQKAVAVPYGTIYDLDVDATNKYMVTSGQDKRVNIWQVRTGKHVRSYKPDGPTGELYKVCLDPSGIYAATCSFDKWIRVFDFYSGRCLARVAGHSELVTGVRFSPDGRRLVSVGGDGCIFVWRLPAEMTRAMQERLMELQTSLARSIPVPAWAIIRTEHSPVRPSAARKRSQPEAGREEPAKGENVGECADASAAAAQIRIATADLPAWAQGKGGVPRKDSGKSKKSNSPPREAMGKWAERIPQNGVGLELFGQVVNPHRLEDRKALTLERLDVSSRVAAAVEEGDGVVMGDLDEEGDDDFETPGVGLSSGDEESGKEDSIEGGLKIEEEEVVVAKPDEDEETEGEEDQERKRQVVAAVSGPTIDEVSTRPASFAVECSRDWKGMLGPLVLDGAGSAPTEGEGEEEEKKRKKDAEWLGSALRDVSSPMTTLNPPSATDVQRLSLSTDFFRAKMKQGQHEDLPLPPPPPPQHAIDHIKREAKRKLLQQQQKQQQQQPLPPPSSDVFPPPAPPYEPKKAVDEVPILSRSLDQEREALKAKEKMKKDTAAAVEQMKARLRAMGLYKEKGGKGAEVTEASGKDPGEDGQGPAPQVPAEAEHEGGGKEAGDETEDYFDNTAELVPPQAVSSTVIDDSGSTGVAGSEAEAGVSKIPAKGGLGGMLKSLFSKPKGTTTTTTTIPREVEEMVDVAKAPATPTGEGEQPVQDHDEDKGTEGGGEAHAGDNHDEGVNESPVKEAELVMGEHGLSSVRSSLAMPRPLETYHQALSDLQAASRRALDLYSELNQVDRSMVSVSSSSALGGDGGVVGDAMAVDDLLASFRKSFQSLGSVAQSVLRDSMGHPLAHHHQDQINQQSVSQSSASQVILESTPPRRETAGRGEDLPVELLEKYSELLFGMVEQKMDRLLLLRSSQATAASTSSPPWVGSPPKAEDTQPPSL